jgi:DNA-3-methyladenine glycosylase I
VKYHDEEWGVPVHDDQHLFEMLVLEGAQAGLSWITVLKKREGYREAFDGFDVARVAKFSAARIEKLLTNPGIVRNRAKVKGAVKTAHAVQAIQAEHGSLDKFLWGFVNHRTVQNRWVSYRDAPTSTLASLAMSKALLGYGAKFVGPTILYAFMQATGMVNDHEVGCFRHKALAKS